MKKLFLLLLIVTLSCNEEEPFDPLAFVLAGDHPAIQKIMMNPDHYEVQVLYTQIDTDPYGNVSFTDYSFKLDSTNYFYPASTVKLPMAVLALEYMDNIQGLSPLTEYTVEGEIDTYTIAEDVKKIFAVSDNDAYNRLYELLGRDQLNEMLTKKGIAPVRIAHRLSVSEANKDERKTLNFPYDYELGGGSDSPMTSLSIQKLNKGKGYIANDSLIAEPMDFSEKNYFPIITQHNLMKRLFFEKNFSLSERFKLSSSSKELIKKSMHTVPRKAGYDEFEFYDSYGKFFIYGTRRGRIQDHIKIYNKVGYAYGTLTDTALITDEREGIQFLLSVTILVNENGIFNDDVYEYEETGLPFLAELGRGLYQWELERNKQAN